MQLDHIVAAVDQSEEGRSALQAALRVGRHSSGKVTALTIEPPVLGAPGSGERADPDGVGLRPGKVPKSAGYSSAVRSGLPGVEIGRFAEEARAGLVILGRKRRSMCHASWYGLDRIMSSPRCSRRWMEPRGG